MFSMSKFHLPSMPTSSFFTNPSIKLFLDHLDTSSSSKPTSTITPEVPAPSGGSSPESPASSFHIDPPLRCSTWIRELPVHLFVVKVYRVHKHIWLHWLFKAIGFTHSIASVLCRDNQSINHIAHNNIFYDHNKQRNQL